jgi:hypothetical protein
MGMKVLERSDPERSSRTGFGSRGIRIRKSALLTS